MGLYKSTNSQPISVVPLNVSNNAYISKLDNGLLRFPEKVQPEYSIERIDVLSHGSMTSSESSRSGSLSRTRSVFSRADSVRSAMKRGATPGTVFGAPLEKTLEVAGISMPTYDAAGERTTIPVLVEECGRFIISKEDEASADFIPGDSARINILRQTLGSGHSNTSRVWTYCNAQDASSLLCDYLYSLPDPVIPVRFYTAFRAPLHIKAGSTLDTLAAITTYQSLIAQLPPAHRHLLLHLLDLFATLCAQNRYKLRNILAIRAAPAMLRLSSARQRSFGGKMRELLLAGDDSVPVLMFLVRNQAHFALTEEDGEDGEMKEATLVSVVGASRQCVQVVDVHKRES